MTAFPTPVELLQTLLRFDTTNPPGNEAACIAYLKDLLDRAGLSTTILARDESRPNLIARLPGRGAAEPLLLYGHVDVVTTVDQRWTHPPFAADIADGFIWGRGALDMKGGVAMMVSALLRAKAAGDELPGDIFLIALSDEEDGADFGARYLVEQHADALAGIRYAIGEFGGFSMDIAGKKFYPIMVAEKQVCSVRVTIRGLGGHGSVPLRGGAMARLGRTLWRLDRQRLPVHLTPVVRQMIETISATMPFPKSQIIGQLLNPALTDRVLDLLGEAGNLLSPVLHNTASPTIVRGGQQINVIPSEISLELDGRLLPGFTPADMLAELGRLLGKHVTLEVTGFDPGPGEPDMRHFPMLAQILGEADPTGVPIPYLLTGVTDGRFLARLGIQTYGFLPMDLPPGLIRTVHDADERLPVEAMEFGTRALHQALHRFSNSPETN